MNAKQSSSRTTLLALLAVSGLLAGLLWWVFFANPAANSKLSPERLKELISLASVGLGHLENNEPLPSIDIFQVVSDELPEQKLGLRNLAITKFMRFQELDVRNDREAWQAAFQDAQATLTELREAEPDSPVSYVLAARLQQALGNADEQVALLQQAAERASGIDRAAIDFEIFLANEDTAAIQSAYKQLPENRVIAVQWLLTQATNQDPSIVDTLTNVEQITKQFQDDILKRERISLQALIQDAKQAAQQQDWPTVQQKCGFIFNVLLHRTKSDRTRVERHPLDYVMIDFPAQFYQEHQLSRKTLPPPIEVSYSPETTALPNLTTPVLDVVPVDFDLDQSDDLAVLTGTQLFIFERNDEGVWAPTLTHDLDRPFERILTADLDADTPMTRQAGTRPETPEQDFQPSADADFVLYGPGGLEVLENVESPTGERTLQSIAQSPEVETLAAITGAVLGDFDLDGDLDVFISTDQGIQCLTNRDGLHFAPWPAEFISQAENVRFDQAILVDWDRDMDVDLLIPAGPGHTSGYLENLRHGRMIWRPFDESFGAIRDARTLEIADLDANASWDLIGGSPQGLHVAKTSTPVAGRVICQSVTPIDDFAATQIAVLDYDNDGSQDLLASNANATTLRRNLWGGAFASSDAAVPGLESGTTRSNATDLDGDGDLDLVALQDGQVTVYLNQGGNANDWVTITLIAQQVIGQDPKASGRVNQYGIGSLLELKSGVGYQPLVARGARTHFGVGHDRPLDIVRITWTNGIPQNIIQPSSRTTITELESPKASCPFLYAWNGEKYAFVTDCLWAAPLGLQTANAEIMPDRDWEWLRIASDQLQPLDGQYRLQITEELWEAAYIDQVELIAVDHPAEIDIYTNEKVGPAAIAMPEIHQVGKRLVPQTVTNARGQDVLDWVAQEDGRYLQGFQGRIRQGYTDLHYLELDLGKLEQPGRVTLFLTGWIFPTDTSINIQLSQDPQLAGPRLPYLTIPDGNGGWKTAREFIGFPGGKTKTIAVDVTELCQSGDHRMRVCTSAEIYWDAVFYTVDPPKLELQQQNLPLLSADLHYRGFSARKQHPLHGPEQFDYDRVTTEPVWPTMDGFFTRYGDVTPIIADADDRQVVLGAGDEMTLCFAVPEKPLPAGWKRDFILHNIGWDKDGDLNTVLGETVEPLPFRSMSAYPIPPGDQPPNTPAYRDYLREYQTRRQEDGPFQHWVRQYRRP